MKKTVLKTTGFENNKFENNKLAFNLAVAVVVLLFVFVVVVVVIVVVVADLVGVMTLAALSKGMPYFEPIQQIRWELDRQDCVKRCETRWSSEVEINKFRKIRYDNKNRIDFS